jgi:CRP-like cAMP-binding protein
MPLVIDTLRTSTITEELADTELEIIAGLFEIQNCKSGEKIVKPEAKHPDNLYILAHGEIEVKIHGSDGETTIHALKRGDLAGIITFVGGAPSQHSAMLYAKGETKVLSLERAKFETLIDSHPLIVYKVMRGIVRNVHGIVRQMNAQSAALNNYIYRSQGGY